MIRLRTTRWISISRGFYSQYANKNIQNNNKITLIDSNGKKLGEFSMAEARKHIRSPLSQQLINVNKDQNIWKISDKPTNTVSNTSPSLTATKSKTPSKDSTVKQKSEKEFKISTVITDHDLIVKIAKMKGVLMKGHACRVVLVEKKQKFTLYQPQFEPSILDHVMKELKGVYKVLVSVTVMRDGSQFVVLGPKSEPQPSAKKVEK